MKNVITVICLCLLMVACGKKSQTAESTPTKVAQASKTVDENGVMHSHDLEFFELHGNVKTLITEYDTLQFNKDGMFVSVNGCNPFDRNNIREMDYEYVVYTRSNGFITGEERLESTSQYFWNGDKPAGNNWSAEAFTGTDTYYYDENGLMTKMECIQTEYDGEAESIVATYDYTAFDDQHNWISRTIKANNSDELTVETREILYW